MAAEWWIKWQMNFPVNKCKVTYAGGKKKHLSSTGMVMGLS